MSAVRSKLEKEDPRPELFFGLIGAVGTDIRAVANALQIELQAFKYNSHHIRLSQQMRDVKSLAERFKKTTENEYERINAYMDAGNDLRKSAGRGDAILLLGIQQLRAIRRDLVREQPTSPNSAYIFDSLKHPQEVKTLRKIYGKSAQIISVYAPKHLREETLARKIAKGRGNRRIEDCRPDARKLIDRDQIEEGTPLGQSVRDTFFMGDFFVDAREDIRSQVRRLVRLLFGDPFITPTIEEYGMFHAKAASLRSADLSRQVGAMLLTARGEHVAAGCNEVPMAGGGHYWEGDPTSLDDRDFQLGADQNTLMKYEMIGEVFQKIKDLGWLSRALNGKSGTELAAKVFDPTSGAPFKELRVANIIEFGRIVHAEMSALMDAARRGISVKDSTLICTTFPCHMCARHIIAAGIARVVYIEPYPKSMATELYEKSIWLDDEEEKESAVNFTPFIGVAPSRFLEFFDYRPRKDKLGYIVSWHPDEKRFPVCYDPSSSYEVAETYSSTVMAKFLRTEAAKKRGSGHGKQRRKASGSGRRGKAS